MKRLAFLVLLCACGSDANVAGNYSIDLTNRDNGCNFNGWTVGSQAAVPVLFTQSGSEVTATVQGVTAALLLDGLLGDHVFKGSVDGDTVALDIQGTVAQQMGNCAFTYNSAFDAKASGDSMSGRIDYRTATNNQSDCAAIKDCVTFQEFAGARPPP